jgi:general secretion pathway protein J
MKRDDLSCTAAWEAGFSLVELLVSLVLISLVAALLASSLGFGQRVWHRSEERAQASRVMFDAQAALRRLFDNMQPLRVASQDTRAIDFRGSADQLEGIVPLPTGIGLGGLYRLHLFRDSSARRVDLTFQAYERDKASDDAAAPTTLASDIEGMEFGYFGKARGEEAPGWRDEWKDQDELPTLISIKITAAKTDVAWPELLIAPRVKAVDWR